MNLAERKARWAQMVSQAAGFARMENTVDALARARLYFHEAREALDQAGTEPERHALRVELRRAEQQVAEYERLHAEWQEKTRQRADLYQANEKERYEKPLPLPGEG
jgi:hypothetical protein